jgi:hypothetical protein
MGSCAPANVRAQFVEVKGPRDRLSPQQRMWLLQLASILTVQVCYIKEGAASGAETEMDDDLMD